MNRNVDYIKDNYMIRQETQGGTLETWNKLERITFLHITQSYLNLFRKGKLLLAKKSFLRRRNALQGPALLVSSHVHQKWGGPAKKGALSFFHNAWIVMLQTSFLPSSANCAIVWWIICAIIYNQETDSDYLTGKSLYTSTIVCTWCPNGCCNDEVFKGPSINLNKFRWHAFVTKRGIVTFLLVIGV